MVNTMNERIKIVDESDETGLKFQLYIDNCRRAVLTKRGERVDLHWQVYGAQAWPEAKVLMTGLTELAVLAEGLIS